MTPGGCGLLWAAAVVAGFAALRPSPVPARLGALVSTAAAAARPDRHRPSSRRTRLAAGSTVLLGLVGLTVAPLLALAAAVAVPVIIRWRRARRGAARRAAVIDGLPEVVDLAALAVNAGYTVALIVPALARRAGEPFAAAFGQVAERAARGHRLADALGMVPAELGEEVRPLVAALVATERYGVPLGPALEHVAYDARRERRRRADVAARRLPVRLCFPLVCCTLPAFGLLTIAPLLAGALRSLRL